MTSLQWSHRNATHGRSDVHLVVCHGFGANGRDLADLGPMIDPEGAYSWHFPQAPIALFPGSWAWFPSATHELEQALTGELWRHLPDWDSQSIDSSLDLLDGDIDTLGIPRERTIFAGFSQGSMMALFMSLRHQPLGLVLWSSALVARNRLAESAAKLPPTFQSHGRSDTVLRPESGLALTRALEERGTPVESMMFPGAHEITAAVCDRTGAYLKTRITSGLQP